MLLTSVDSAVFVLDGDPHEVEIAERARDLLSGDVRWSVVTVTAPHPLITSGATGFAAPILTPEEMEHQAEADREDADERTAAVARSLGGRSVRQVVGQNDLASVVGAVLEQEPGAVVVASSTDVAEDLTDGDIPLVLALSTGSDPGADDPVLVALDDSRLDEHVVDTVISLVGPGREILTVHVVPPVGPQLSATAFGTVATALPPDLDDALLDGAEEAARRVTDRAEADGVASIGSVGDPVNRILDLADEHDVAMIVLGTRNRGWLSKLLRPSVSDEVRRRTERPVLVIR